MPRLTWLVEELRKVGLRVEPVAGWSTRGSSDFAPVGVTWHATAGSRTSSAQGEVNVILRGSTSAPPPIAQLMIYRDGTIYVCAAGRCNHNKVGWDGPNKGLGNTSLLGIEMANDNRGEPWPDMQLDAARRATAAIMKRLGADPMKRLAGHYEHQPYATRPAGEGSTKSDPYGVDMQAERSRVAAIIKGDDMPSIAEVRAAIREELAAERDDIVKGVWMYQMGDPEKPLKDGKPQTSSAGGLLRYLPQRVGSTGLKVTAAIAASLEGDDQAIAQIREQLAALPQATADAVLDQLGAAASPQEKADLLRAVLGEDAAEVGRLLAGQAPA